MARVPPGGNSTINIFGGGADDRFSTSSRSASATAASNMAAANGRAAQQPPGGQSSINIFGGESASAPAPRGISSNAYANGASQNTGNVLTDRSTSRVLAPPGGHSSLNIFGGGGEDTRFSHSSRSSASSAAAAAGGASRAAQQPPGGQSSINIFGGEAASAAPAPRGQSSNVFANGANQNCGNVITDRPSSRVLAPPGGRSAMGTSFGWDDSNSSSAAPAARGRARVAEPENRVANVVAPAEPVAAAPAKQGGQSSNAFANGANQNCGNVITDRPSSRVLAPPGGRSAMGTSFAW